MNWFPLRQSHFARFWIRTLNPLSCWHYAFYWCIKPNYPLVSSNRARWEIPELNRHVSGKSICKRMISQHAMFDQQRVYWLKVTILK